MKWRKGPANPLRKTPQCVTSALLARPLWLDVQTLRAPLRDTAQMLATLTFIDMSLSRASSTLLCVSFSVAVRTRTLLRAAGLLNTSAGAGAHG